MTTFVDADDLLPFIKSSWKPGYDYARHPFLYCVRALKSLGLDS